jgi:hypothetical protein
MSTEGRTAPITSRPALSDPAYQAFLALRMTFVVAPILFGLDKFANLLTDWPGYLAPWIDDAYAAVALSICPPRNGWWPS